MASVGLFEVWGWFDAGQNVPSLACECRAQRDELGQAPRYARGGGCVGVGLHQGFVRVPVGRAVGDGCCFGRRSR